MIYYKTQEEIELIRQSSLLVAKTQAEIAKVLKPGITALEVDKIAEEFIRDNGAEPGFKGYGGFPNTLCMSFNSGVVHGIPTKQVIKDGDIISIDCGTLMNGFYGDSAYTFAIGDVAEETLQLLKITKESLYKGIEKAVVGTRLGDLSFAIQDYCESHGYSVVRELVGHGVGRQLHEGPEVPNYGRRGKGGKLKEGMVIAIEPMINLGAKEVKQEDDGWTITTKDGSPSAHFEHTVAVGIGIADILSSFEFVEEALKNNKEVN